MSALIRYSTPANTLADLMDDFFGESAFESAHRELTNGSWPRVDISEEDDHYLMHADLPGMDKNEVKIRVEQGTLTIEGEKKAERKKEKGKYRHLERSYGRFSRSFTLPEEIEEQRIEAKMNNGVLELKLPKNERAKRKAIEIKVN
ncbi:Hsp20/alpha crystallin family protein [Chitinispirillales bacterium ANBcel5]|uniref:Hsp20/alpha crystallin family protein n=1 Tax=Cellulosispirillum alkaliphilum TaxID=3039283 RepID=UPI002A56BF40|nr:Hsp20/alpha crystallin family protein [Chitinispirillales bacterium ANBcel5]